MKELSIDNLPLDYVVIILVILSGEFQKRYLADIKSIGKLKINGAWATLMVSAVFTIAYALLVKLSGAYSRDLPLKWFLSYVTATSLYELFLKALLKRFMPTDALVKLIIICTMLAPMTSCKVTYQDQAVFQSTHSTMAVTNALLSSHPAVYKATDQEQLLQQQTSRQLGALLISVLLTALVAIFGGILIVRNIIKVKQQYAHHPLN